MIALGDLNNDLRSDLLVAAAGELVVVFKGLDQRARVPPRWLGAGQPDPARLRQRRLARHRGGRGRLRVWRNLGQAGFGETTPKLGLDKAVRGRIESLADDAAMAMTLFFHLLGAERIATAVQVRKVAPLGDPLELTVRGYELSIRKGDAETIEVE